jgi:hypothetical protein
MLDALAETSQDERATDLRMRKRLQIERKLGIRDLPRANGF